MDARIEFANRRFRIECEVIELTQRSQEKCKISGPGELWQNERGEIEYKIFADPSNYEAIKTHRRKERPIGGIVPEEDYFDLLAIQHSGPVWTSEKCLSSFRGGFNSGMVIGRLRKLSSEPEERQFSEFDTVSLRYWGNLKFPINRGSETVTRIAGELRKLTTGSAAVVDDGQYRLEIHHESEHTILTLRLPWASATKVTEWRIHEAFQFTMGQKLQLLVVERGSQTHRQTDLYSNFESTGTAAAPLRFRELEECEDFWRIFMQYFRHTHSYVGDDWHPIGQQILKSFQDRHSLFTSKVLPVCVAVEGLVRQFDDLRPDLDSVLECDIKIVRENLATMGIGEQCRKRLDDFLKSMTKPSASDLVKQFVVRNGISKRLFDSWRKLRNSSAHGGTSNTTKIEEMVERVHCVQTLMNLLVLSLIKYNGTFTDYSSENWPKKKCFPVSDLTSLSD